LAEPAAPPPQAHPTDVTAGVFRPGPDLPLVTLRIGRRARWITEYYPCEEVRREGERWLVALRVSDLAWARRLVLGLGPEVTVVGPPDLVTAVGAEARAALDAYAARPAVG
jgi:proteasome accessory factor C